MMERKLADQMTKNISWNCIRHCAYAISSVYLLQWNVSYLHLMGNHVCTHTHTHTHTRTRTRTRTHTHTHGYETNRCNIFYGERANRWITIWMTLIVTGWMAILFSWVLLKLHLYVYRETTIWYLKRKEHLGKVCVLQHKPRHLQSCYTEQKWTITFLVSLASFIE
jgi:hypothetical protein